MATINDIARIAGVSAATVSHVVNKTRFVSPELVSRVEAAIESIDPPPNFIIRKMKNKSVGKIKKKFIVYITSDIHNPFYLEVDKNIREQFENLGYPVITLDCRGLEKWEMYGQAFLSSDNLAGVVISGDILPKDGEKYLSHLKAPVTIIGNAVPGLECDRVSSMNFEGAYKAVIHLIRSGHERIALLCGDKNSESNTERINGFKKALEDNQIELSEDLIITDLVAEEALFQTLKKLLYGAKAPTAIFAANYNTVFTIFKFMEMNNIQCPKELSIVGFNDFQWASLLSPPVTTIAQNVDELCSNAVEILHEKILQAEEENVEETVSFQTIHVPTELRVRGSTSGIGRGPFGERACSADILQLSEADIAKCRKGNFTAAISFHYTGQAWMRLHEQGIRDVFDLLNISLVAITDAHFDSSLQIKQLESLSMLDVDALISMPTDNIKTAAAFKKIAGSRMKLILITNVPEGLTPQDYSACVSVNERSHGRYAGRGLGEYMSLSQKKNIGLIKHGASFYATNQRDMAAEQILSEEYPHLNICGSVLFQSQEEVYEKTMQLMRQYPEINGLYVSWEGPAQHVLSALSDLRRTDVAVSTADLEYHMALNMAKGNMVKAISAQCPYEQGQAMALCAANALLGNKIPSFIGIEPIYVTSDNLLKAWAKVYKENPPAELLDIIKNNQSQEWL